MDISYLTVSLLQVNEAFDNFYTKIVEFMCPCSFCVINLQQKWHEKYAVEVYVCLSVVLLLST